MALKKDILELIRLFKKDTEQTCDKVATQEFVDTLCMDPDEHYSDDYTIYGLANRVVGALEKLVTNLDENSEEDTKELATLYLLLRYGLEE